MIDDFLIKKIKIYKLNMKSEIINILKIVGVGCNEIIINMQLDNIYIDTIEYISPDDIIIHHFEGDLDFEINFDDIDYKGQKDIYHKLMSLIYN